MTKRQFIYFMGVLILPACTFFEKEEPVKGKDRIVVKKAIAEQVGAALSKDECLAVDITESGLCEVTDYSAAEVYLRPNSTLTEYFKDSVSKIGSLKFCYAYKSKDGIIVRFHEAYLGDQSPIITMTIQKDSFGIHHSYWRDGKILMESDTKYQELIINKKGYQIGDSISGYLSFRGIHKSKEKVGENFKGYFKCIIDSSMQALDHVKHYQKCSVPQ